MTTEAMKEVIASIKAVEVEEIFDPPQSAYVVSQTAPQIYRDGITTHSTDCQDDKGQCKKLLQVLLLLLGVKTS